MYFFVKNSLTKWYSNELEFRGIVIAISSGLLLRERGGDRLKVVMKFQKWGISENCKTLKFESGFEL